MVVFLKDSLPGYKPVKMSMFAGAQSVLTGLLLCLSISSAQDQDILLVRYPKATLKKKEGEPLIFNCTITYNQTICGNIYAYWCKYNETKGCSELLDPGRYLIQVSEKQVPRSRLITMSIDRLTLEDRGTFQCNAQCGDDGVRARGNFIDLTVSKADPKRNPPKNCGINRVEVFSITLYSLFFLVYSPACL